MSKQVHKSLKALNIPGLSAVILVDILIAIYAVAPASLADWKSLAGGRLLVGGVFPVVCMLLSGLVSPNLKAVLVYWRRRDVLPGCRAFSHHAPSDPRVDLVALVKKVGELPMDASAQNSLWYKLYRAVEMDTAVRDVHKSFLLFRDLAAMSLVGVLACPLLVIWFPSTSVGKVALVLLGQYVLAALSARWAGIRLVTTVLAKHTADIPKAKKTTKSRGVV